VRAATVAHQVPRARKALAGVRGDVLVLSKLHPPAGRPGSVVRRDLLVRLDDSVSAKLVLVAAPAGWGKTSLLRDWCSADEASRTAWLSVDQDDNDPVRFWAHVVAAIATVSPGVGEASLQVLTAPGAKDAEGVLTPLINDLAPLAAPVTLILDDYHLISNPKLLECVEYLVDHLPPSLRLVVSARSDPILPLARLRARGEMTEIRAEALSFSDAEAAELLNGTLGLDLAPADIDALQRRTEGWAAGLYLAGLSLRGRPEPSVLVRAFAGDDRQIVDYLVAEVLDALPADVRSFMMRTSVLSRMCGPLCDAVTASGGSGRILEGLERSNQFVVPLDANRQWYRYHQLFAELLRHELDQAEPGHAPVLHSRASAWHRQHGSIAEAIGHAISAGELADARELIARHWNAYINEGLAETVEAWLNRLPPAMVTEDARMCLVMGWISRHLGRLGEVEPWLEAAEAATPKGPLTEGSASIESCACMLRAGYRHMIGDLAGAESASRQAAALEAAGTPQWQAVASATLGASLCWQGKDSEARTFLRRVAGPIPPPANNFASLWAQGCLAAIATRNGDPETAEDHVQRAMDMAARHGLGEYWVAATALLTSAELLECHGHLADAEAAARSGLRLAERGQARLETAYAELCLAGLAARAGSSEDARARVSAARRIITACADPGVVLTELLAGTADCVGRPPPPDGPRPLEPSEPLSQREDEILRWLNSQLSLREIASELYVSYDTVKTHTRHIYRKLGVSTRQQAVTRARTSNARLVHGSSWMHRAGPHWGPAAPAPRQSATVTTSCFACRHVLPSCGRRLGPSGTAPRSPTPGQGCAPGPGCRRGVTDRGSRRPGPFDLRQAQWSSPRTPNRDAPSAAHER
jgi:LuxR family transcriptional regulator, maltose regulon positive regulatory protein